MQSYVIACSCHYRIQGYMMLQEGGGSKRVCVGFDDAATIDIEVYFTVAILIQNCFSWI